MQRKKERNRIKMNGEIRIGKGRGKLGGKTGKNKVGGSKVDRHANMQAGKHAPSDDCRPLIWFCISSMMSACTAVPLIVPGTCPCPCAASLSPSLVSSAMLTSVSAVGGWVVD